MGTNRRYAAYYDRIATDRYRAEAMASGAVPASLTDAELHAGNPRLMRADQPFYVTAWVHYGNLPVLVSGVVWRWTARASRVSWNTPTGQVHRAWVWKSAVEERAPRGGEQAPHDESR